MERQILFRGFSKILNRWIEGYLIQIGESKFIRSLENGNSHRVHPDSVGQFTGLCDMDGVKIFEGHTITSLERKSAESVIFINGAFRLTGYSDNNKAPILDSFEAGALKITGNTFKP